MYFLLVIFIIFAVMMNDKNNEIKFYKKKISELEAKIKRLELNQNPNVTNQTASSIREVPKTVSPPPQIKEKSNVVAQNVVRQTLVTNNVPEIDEAERLRKIEKKKRIIRNNAILTIGASFIVVAALSFLYSTWYTVPNIVKSAVVLILAGMFFGLSKVASKVFNLTKTARTFFYIAMAYIPLCLFSISFLGLAGEYFSISGDGRYIYLTIASLLVMVTYLFFGLKNKDKKLYLSGLIMQLISVICFGLIFAQKFDSILTAVLIYSAIFAFFTQKKEILFAKVNKIYSLVLICTCIYFSSGILVFSLSGSITEVLLALAVLMNIIDLYKISKNGFLYVLAYVASIFVLVKVINLEVINISFIMKQILVVLYVIYSTIYYNFKYEKLSIAKAISVVNFIAMFILAFITKFIINEGIASFALAAVSILISTIEYIKNKRETISIYSISLIFNGLIFLIPNTFSNYSVSLIEYIVCTITALSLILILHKDNKAFFKIIPLILLFINLYRYDIVLFEKFDFTYVLNVLAILGFSVLSIMDKKDFSYRITSLLFLIGFIIDIEEFIDIYTASLLISMWTWIQYYFASDVIKGILRGFTFAPLIITYFCILDNYITVLPFLIAMAESLVCLYVNRNNGFKLVPLLGIMIPLYNYEIIAFEKISITFFLNLLIIIVTGFLALKDKDDIVYRITSLFYLIGMCIYAEMSVYVGLLLITLWALIQMLYTEGEIKKGMKSIIILSLALMYMVMLEGGPSEITVKAYTITIIESLFCWFIFSRSKWLKALPIVGLMIPLYSYDILALGKYDITFLVNIALVIILSYCFINSKKDKVYMITSFVYLLGLVLNYYEINIYIKLALFIVWGFVNYLYTDGGIREIMKVLIATCGLAIYMNVLEDVNLLEVTALKILGFLFYVHIITRGILKNYLKEYKVFEYIACIYIFIGAFNMYCDAVDLAIFIAMQVVVLMFSYSKKYGPLFAVNIPAIIINMFYLTQNFWLAIPWWAYLVCIGGVLIVFAARNELSEKKDIKTVKEKIEKVKNYLDM